MMTVYCLILTMQEENWDLTPWAPKGEIRQNHNGLKDEKVKL